MFKQHWICARHRFSPHIRAVFAEAERKGLEGILAKRADSDYRSGVRTDGWLKIKTSKRQEVVVVGLLRRDGHGRFLVHSLSRHERIKDGAVSATLAPASAMKR